MREHNRVALLTALLAAGVLMLGVYSPLWAADTPTALSTLMPEREHEFAALFADAQKSYGTNHNPATAKDARIGLQLRVITFLRQSQAIENWVGTLKTRGITPEGNGWLSIDIGNGATISTWQTERDDLNFGTLLRPHAPMFAALNDAKIGQTVTFSGIVLKSVLTGDDDMVSRPQFVARLSAFKVGQ